MAKKTNEMVVDANVCDSIGGSWNPKADHCYLFALTTEDVQSLAEEDVGRRLDKNELTSVRRGIEDGLGDWSTVVQTAIGIVVKG